MTWVYRSLCGLCLASYWAFYGSVISWRLPVSGFLVFALAVAVPEIGTMAFVAMYPVLLYFNQYPQPQFSAATFLVMALVLGLSFRRPAQLWVPLAVVGSYFCLSVARYQQNWASTLQGAWTTDQMSPTLYAGTCVMWATGIMFFDFIRRMNPRRMYYGLIAQGAIFAAMSLGNIWIRKKTAVQYQFLFGDVNAFAAYLVLQLGLLSGLAYRSRKPVWAAASILFIIDSLFLIASWSRSGLVAYFAGISTYACVMAAVWIREEHHRILKAVAVAVLLIITGATVYKHSEVFAAGNSLYQGIKPALPAVVRREVTARIVDLRQQLSTRVRLITPDALYLQRVRDWKVPLAVIEEYPLFGIGIGAFYRNSLTYAKKTQRDRTHDVYVFYFAENAHNNYLQIAAEAGLTGLSFFLSFLAWLFYKHLKVTDPIKLGCGFALAGLIILCLAQHPLLVDRFFFVFAMICGVMAGSDKNAEQAVWP